MASVKDLCIRHKFKYTQGIFTACRRKNHGHRLDTLSVKTQKTISICKISCKCKKVYEWSAFVQ